MPSLRFWDGLSCGESARVKFSAAKFGGVLASLVHPTVRLVQLPTQGFRFVAV